MNVAAGLALSLVYEVDEFCKLQEEQEGPLEMMRRFQPETQTHGYVWVCLRKDGGAQRWSARHCNDQPGTLP